MILYLTSGRIFYEGHELTLNRDKSQINSSKQLKNREATINQKNRDEEYFQKESTIIDSLLVTQL